MSRDPGRGPPARKRRPAEAAFMTPDAGYQASRIKRQRATKAEIEERRAELCEIVAAMHPMTVRQVFYQATVRGIVEKSEAGYGKVQTDLVHMRKAGFWRRRPMTLGEEPGTLTEFLRLPYGWLADNTRWQRKPDTYNSIGEALRNTAAFYRKALWTEAGSYVEIWLEKDALSGVVYPVTQEFDVPLMVARGYASLSFLHSAAEFINTLYVPTYIYHLGDFDPSGVNAGEKIEETLRELAPDTDIMFERIAVTPTQIQDWRLPKRPTKQSDSRAKTFGAESVELDAIEPGRLRQLVRDAIERHLPPDQFEVLKAAEESERLLLAGLVGMFGSAP
jgi:hypothetical protein